MPKQKVVAIVGPTCTGKTALSIKIAKQVDGEIICADSRTIYRYFDIGTAKPSKAEQGGIPHHLIDFVEPEVEFTAAKFKDMAELLISEISARDKLPIVCGGTGFYSRALLEGLSMPDVPPQQELRDQFEREADENGNLYLHDKLKNLDPQTANRLMVNDRFRVIRALEVCISTGKTFSSLAGKREETYETLWIGLNFRDRDKLREILKLRLAEQMKQGMLEEVQNLYARYGRSQRIMKTVNYLDLVRFIDGEMNLEEAVAEAERRNYQLARRQMMWFKTNPQINWHYVDETPREKIEVDVLDQVRSFLRPS